MLTKIAARNRFFQEFWKVQNIIIQNWVHRRPFRQHLAGIFGNFKLLAFQCHGLKWMVFFFGVGDPCKKREIIAQNVFIIVFSLKLFLIIVGQDLLLDLLS